MHDYLIYGANGYSGELIARAAVARGQRPILAGRNAGVLAELGQALQLEHRVFALDRPEEIIRGLQGVRVVLHCAGPFSHTFRPMAEACLHTGVHYLDITGEVEVYETLAARSADARAAGIMFMPGVGFDVVPSDCLAAHLKRRLPTATHLALGFQSLGRASRGTATTVVENLGGGGLVRMEGALKQVPAAWKKRVIDFGRGPVPAVTIPWGDVATAFHSTGIPNIEVYLAAPWGLRCFLRASRYLGWLLRSGPVQGFFKWRIRSGPPGPTAVERERGRMYLWGEVTDDRGGRAVTRLQGPEGYTFTVRAALAVLERVLAGEAPVGFQTPATAYGPDFVLGIAGVTRTDEGE